MRIGVIGLGKLGLPLACLFGDNPSNQVTGYDINEDYIGDLLLGRFKTQEPSCDYTNTVCFTSHIESLVDRTDISFLCVNTPVDSEGNMNYSQVVAACEDLFIALKGKEYHLVICSTVLPGACLSVVKPTVGLSVHVYSTPVWIAMGSVIKDLKNPPVLVIGTEESDYHTPLKAWMSISELSSWDNLIVTDTRTAEFIKLAHNSWCCTKMSYMGYLKDQSDRFQVNINDIANFFQNGGERSGSFWRPGPSFSGPCFPRDLTFWNRLTQHPITCEAELINENRVLQIVADIPDEARVLVLGSGYKYGVQITEGSLSFKIRDKLKEYRPTVEVAISDGEWDPKFRPTHCIVTHKELENTTPSQCEVIKLW